MSKLFFVPSQLAICHRLRGEIWWPGWRMHVSWWEILLSKENLWEAVVALWCFVWLVVLNQTTTLWLIFFSKSQIYSAHFLHKKQVCAWCFFLAKGTIFLKPQDFVAKTVSWMCHFLCSQGWFMQHKTTGSRWRSSRDIALYIRKTSHRRPRKFHRSQRYHHRARWCAVCVKRWPKILIALLLPAQLLDVNLEKSQQIYANPAVFCGAWRDTFSIWS